MDINPSVHLEINRFNKIIQAKPLNNDAKRLLSSMNIAYQDTAESMNKIIDTAKSMGYLTDKNKYVVIDCYTNEDSLVTDVSNNTKKYSAVGIDVIVEKASKSELDLSNKLGISMLAPFTKHTAALIKGVNIGGLGTLVASLASLISFKLYAKTPDAKIGLYIGVFSVINFAFLAVFLVLGSML